MTNLSRSAAIILALTLLSGCDARYITPGGPASFRALGIAPEAAESHTDRSIAERLNRKPLAAFPAAVAVARVQDAGYRSRTASGFGYGRFTLVSVRDAEEDAQFERLASLPMLRGLAPLNRIVAPPELDSEKDLREAAASVQADMLLLYTFDTRFGDNTTVPFAGVITLGLFPNEEQIVNTTASAALIDTRSGYVYGLAESTARVEKLANAWTREEAADDARLEAERRAFAGLVTELEKTWGGVVRTYGPAGK